MESESSRYAIDLQDGTNWLVIPSDENLRESVRSAQRSKYSTTKTCMICKQPFDYGYVSLKTCCACKIIAKCAVCEKVFELNMNGWSGTSKRRVFDQIFSGNDITVFCSQECKRLHGAEAKKAWHQQNPNAMKEARKRSTKEFWCNRCKMITKHYCDYCMRCHGKWAVQKMIQYGKEHPEEEKKHRQECIKAAQEHWKRNPELMRLNAVKNLGQYAFSSLYEKDGQLWFTRYGTGESVLWEEYKRIFESSIQKLCVQDFQSLGFVAVPTFRERKSVDWSCRARAAFEQYLVDIGIGWFVYIKFFETHDGTILPLVVGKSGSLLVNRSGSDVNFGLWDGLSYPSEMCTPARRLLHDEGLNWYVEHILVLSCIDEKVAFSVEKDILEKYRLFGS